MSTSRSFRLLAEAPRTRTARPGMGFRRLAGTGMSARPVRYSAVAEPAADLAQDKARHLLGQTFGKREPGEEALRLADGEAVDLRDGEPAHAEVERLGLDARAAARRARRVAPEAREEDAHVHAVGAALEPAEPAAHAGVVAAAVALEHQRVLRRRELRPRDAGRDAAAPAELEQLAPLPAGRPGRPRLDGALGEGAARVGDDQIQVEVDHAPEAATRLARPERAVEGEEVRHRVAHREAARRALERAREALDAVARVREPDGGAAAAVAERLLERLDQAPVVQGAQSEPVLHDGEPAVARRRRRGALEVDQALRPERAHEAGGEQPRAHLVPGKPRGHGQIEGHHRTGPLVPGEQAGGGALGCVALDGTPARPAVRHAHLGEEQLQVIVQLGHGPDRGARGLHRPALVDRDRRQDARDALDARLLHPIEELAGVGREALDIAPLALGVEHVEGERGLPGPRHARHHRDGLERHPDVDALQVVLAGTDDLDRGLVHEGVYGCARGGGRGIAKYTGAAGRGKRERVACCWDSGVASYAPAAAARLRSPAGTSVRPEWTT